MSAIAPATRLPSGSGRGSGSSAKVGSRRAEAPAERGRSGKRRVEVRSRRARSWDAPSIGPRPSRPSGDESPRAERPCTRSKAGGPERSGGWRRPAILPRDGKAGSACRRKIAGRSHCRDGPFVGRSPSRRPWRGPFSTDERIPAGMRTAVLTTFPVAGYAAAPKKRATSCGANCTRRLARSASTPSCRRSSLKSPKVGESVIASIPTAFARSINVAIAPSPAGSSSRTI